MTFPTVIPVGASRSGYIRYSIEVMLVVVLARVSKRVTLVTVTEVLLDKLWHPIRYRKRRSNKIRSRMSSRGGTLNDLCK